MELKDFIKDTLVQIVEGVTEAEKIISSNGAHINPRTARYPEESRAKGVMYDASHGIIEPVVYDVALTESEKEEAKAGIGVFLGSIGLGAKAGISEGASSLARIQFKIPLALPTSK